MDNPSQTKPIFESRCIECHGPSKQKSGLRLDQRAILIRGGNSGATATVPGDPAKGHLLELIRGTNPDEIMPPKGNPLMQTEVALIEQWITEGAQWPGQMNDVAKLTTDHWSFQPVKRPSLPSESRNPIDAFLNEKLTQAGVTPNEQADARSLIRRASIILTELPQPQHKSAASRKPSLEMPIRPMSRPLTASSPLPTSANDGHNIGWMSSAGQSPMVPKPSSTARTRGCIATTWFGPSTTMCLMNSSFVNRSLLTRWSRRARLQSLSNLCLGLEEAEKPRCFTDFKCSRLRPCCLIKLDQIVRDICPIT